MEVRPKVPSTRGPDTYFTGEVWFDAIAGGDGLSRARVTSVHFAPRARTAWHSHARGQMLHVIDGVGRVQARGGEIHEIHSGDVVYTPPDEWHWHGAAPDHVMTHLSITEATGDDRRPEADWGAHVTDAEYLGEGR